MCGVPVDTSGASPAFGAAIRNALSTVAYNAHTLGAQYSCTSPRSKGNNRCVIWASSATGSRATKGANAARTTAYTKPHAQHDAFNAPTHIPAAPASIPQHKRFHDLRCRMSSTATTGPAYTNVCFKQSKHANATEAAMPLPCVARTVTCTREAPRAINRPDTGRRTRCTIHRSGTRCTGNARGPQSVIPDGETKSIQGSFETQWGHPRMCAG